MQAQRQDNTATIQRDLSAYSNTKFKEDAFVSFVDAAIAKTHERADQAAILNKVVTILSTRLSRTHEGSDILLRYAKGLEEVSTTLDGLIIALMAQVDANRAIAAKAEPKMGREYLLAALRASIEVQKLIADHLTQKDFKGLPSVSGGIYLGSPNDPEFRAAVKRHNEEELARERILQQNHLIGYTRVMKSEVEGLKKQLNLSDDEFRKIWTQVKSKQIEENVERSKIK